MALVSFPTFCETRDLINRRPVSGRIIASGRLFAALMLGLCLPVAHVSAEPAPELLSRVPAATIRYQQPLTEPPADAAADPAEEDPAVLDLLDLSLEELSELRVRAPAMEQEVTTVSRQVSTVGRSPTAVFVVTNEMIRRSGATSIPEALRMVPGLSVARIDSNKWAISARGFNDRFANKLLVQIDGRSVYNPLFSGVYWDTVDYPLQDVERIEVIRGPGATVWGANAINGVINIITKTAADTQGVLVSAGGGGPLDQGMATVRYGGQRGTDFNYRLYGKWFERGTGQETAGNDHDDWRNFRTGFRSDWTPTACDTVTLQGDIFESTAGRVDMRPQPTAPFIFQNVEDEVTRGGNALLRWTHELGERSDWSLQVYWDHFDREFTNGLADFRFDTYDIDFQQQFPLGERHQLIYGVGYQFIDAFVGDSPRDGGLAFSSAEKHSGLNLVSAFVQDEITLVEDRWYFTAGTKVQHNPFTGVEVQPTARLLWLPSDHSTAWAAVSRAVRTPNLASDHVELTLPPAAPGVSTFVHTVRNPLLVSEDVMAYELGYRTAPTETFTWDLALFFNQYNNLAVRSIGGTPSIPPPPGTTFIPLMQTNDLDGETYGVELAGTWKASDRWQLYAQYTFLRTQLHRSPGSGASEAVEGQSPRNQVYVRSSWDIACDWEFDLIGRYVDHLPGFAPGVPSYITLDARLGWQPRERLELAVVGQNLLDSQHLEFGSNDLIQNSLVEVPRGVYGQVTYQW